MRKFAITAVFALPVAAITAGMGAGQASGATGDINEVLRINPASTTIGIFEQDIEQNLGYAPDWNVIVPDSEVAAWEASQPNFTLKSDLLPLVDIAMHTKARELQLQGINPATEDSQGTIAEFAGQEVARFVDKGYRLQPAELSSLVSYLDQPGEFVNVDGALAAFHAGLGK